MNIIAREEAMERDEDIDTPDIDEEAMERDEFQIEQLVTDFRDEPHIRHDVYPDSDSDFEEDIPEQGRTHITRGDGRLYPDQTFFNRVAFKEAVLDYALRTGRNLKQYRYDKEKIGFRCVGSEDCEWQIYCSMHSNSPVWKVRNFKDSHSCIPNGECEMVKVPVIARFFMDKLRDDPDFFMPMKMEEIIKEKWKISVTRHQCQAARNKALRWIDKEYETQFSRLRDYAAEIEYSNPNSIVVVDTVPNAEGQDEFNRFYVCFDVLRKTWKETCRPLIGVDGCHLRGKMRGQFLVALGRDANNSIYPISWGVVQVENKENWLWFVRRLKVDLGLLDGEGYVMMSDRQKGLVSAVALELPKLEHRMCVRHIYSNLKKKHGSKKMMKPYIWRLAWSYNEAEYNEGLDRILAYDTGVYNDVMMSNPRSWCRAFYKKGSYCEDVENNSTESFNSTIVKAREKHFVPMLETIRRLAMARVAKRSAISHAHNGDCTPYVAQFLAAEHKIAAQCRVTRSTNGYYEAVVSGCSYRVNFDRRTCTCGKWDICGIPCEHAYGVIIARRLNLEDYVCRWFRSAMWRRNFEEGIVPMRGPRFWPSSSAPNVYVPPPPPQPGRKKVSKKDKKRKKGHNESPTRNQPKQLKRIMHCGICGAPNHNSRFHKNEGTRQVQSSQVESSQVQSSQVESSQVQSSQVQSSQVESSQGTLSQAETSQQIV